MRKLTDKAKLEGFGAEAILGDVLEPRSLEKATEGVWAVYHLVHGFESDPKGPALEAIHQQGARNLLHACVENGARRFVYVSILGATASATSRLLASRWLTEELIRRERVGFHHPAHGVRHRSGQQGVRDPAVPGDEVPAGSPPRQSQRSAPTDRPLRSPVVPHPLPGRAAHRRKDFRWGRAGSVDLWAMVDQMAQALGRSRPTVNLPLGVVRRCCPSARRWA